MARDAIGAGEAAAMFLPESPWEMATWRAQHYSLFTAVIRLGFFILSKAPAYLFTRSPLIERRGKHLDELTSKDRAFIRFNQWVTVLLVLNMFHYCTVSPNIRWQLGQARRPREPSARVLSADARSCVRWPAAVTAEHARGDPRLLHRVRFRVHAHASRTPSSQHLWPNTQAPPPPGSAAPLLQPRVA